MDRTNLTNQLKGKAQELGFTLVGVTSPNAPAHTDVYQSWLSANRHGAMNYLATQRAIERRSDPLQILAECKSILVLGIPYDKPVSSQEGDVMAGRIAAYAWGEDYHEVLKERLATLVEYLEGIVEHKVVNRWYTDSGPILERELAQRAGLGWIGKNTMLISPHGGSYFLLAEILLGIELDFDAPITTDHCGTCRRCIDACPTNCILEDLTLDARRCISYLTIELKGPIPKDLRPQMGDWIFGCDICQMACPWNERFANSHGDQGFSAKIQPPKLDKELQLSTQDFNQKFSASPVKRAKRRGYLRNISVALGNSRQVGAVHELTKTLTEEGEPIVRGHAAWALGEIGGELAQAALTNAAKLEKEPSVLEEIKAAPNK